MCIRDSLTPEQTRAVEAICGDRDTEIASSSPCVGFSGCLPEVTSKTEKYGPDRLPKGARS